MGIPQIILIALLFMGLGIEMNRHGQPRTGKHDAWATLLGMTIEFTLLYWGGFFIK
jgi:hypothetical protein